MNIGLWITASLVILISHLLKGQLAINTISENTGTTSEQDFSPGSKDKKLIHQWKLDSISTKKLESLENGGLATIPYRLEIFHYDKYFKHCVERIIYDGFNTTDSSYNTRYETQLPIDGDSIKIEKDYDQRKWNRTRGRVEIIRATPFDTCTQVYKIDTTTKNWTKGSLTCTTYRITDSVTIKTTTNYPNDNYNAYASRIITTDSCGLKIMENRQVKRNAQDEFWITTAKSVYIYNQNGLSERRDYILPFNRDTLVLTARRVWTTPDSNTHIYVIYENDTLGSHLYLSYRELKTTSQSGRYITSEYFHSDAKTKNLIPDRKVIQEFNNQARLLRESTYNFDNGSYDRKERILELDDHGRIMKDLVLYKMNDDTQWDTLEAFTFGYGPTFSQTKALIHVKSTNRNTGDPIDFVKFWAKFDSLNNLIEFNHMLTFASNESKTEIDYYYNVSDNEVLYPSFVNTHVASSEGMWEKVNPIKTRISYYNKEGQWYPQLKTEYFYSQLK